MGEYLEQGYTTPCSKSYELGSGTCSYPSCTLTCGMGNISRYSSTGKYGASEGYTAMIAPPNATKITLDFLLMDTEGYNDGQIPDFVNIYGCSSVSTCESLLASYGGHTLPPPVITETGFMKLVWKSDGEAHFKGWIAQYTAYIPDITGCSQCKPGQYASSTGVTHCDKCKAGTFGSGYGMVSSTTCINCAQGYYSPIAESTICLLCPAGLYGTGMAGTTCESCPMGRFSNATSKSNSTCIPCFPGTYNNVTGASNCDICSAGVTIATARRSSRVLMIVLPHC
jgi:hypothetical protein